MGNAAFNCSTPCSNPGPAPGPTPSPVGPTPEFEKAWRAQALIFAKTVQPALSGANLENLLAGLNTSDPHPPETRSGIEGALPGPSTHPAALHALG
jgi:hypothetical protein